MQGIELIFGILILILSIVVHEVSHGYAAFMLGDKTALYAGRLTMNPLKHLDPLGSVILPILTLIAGGFIFGWAKPVPFNPYNLRNQRWGEAIVAAAGPFSNLVLALAFGLIVRIGAQNGLLSSSFIDIASGVVLINCALMIFNLLPIPPLDGSKILFSFFPGAGAREIQRNLERYSLLFVIIFVLLLARFLSPLVVSLY